jgi:transcriptional regulator with XRE-family HTH domain
MARESEAITTQRRVLGSRLATFRKAERQTQTQLAKRLHYERTSISHLERGSQPAPRTFWERADAALHANGSLLAAFDDLERSRAAEAAAVAAERNDEAAGTVAQWRAAGIAEPVFNGCANSPAEVFESTIWSWQHPAGSDGEVPQAGAAVLHWLMSRDQREHLGHADGWRRIGPNDVRRVHTAREKLKDIDNSLGGGAALPMAVSYLRHEVPPLLSGKYDEPTGRALTIAVAEVALDVGWMAYDAGNQPEARRQMLYALRLAGLAGDRLFGGRVACAMSHQALHLGNVSEAMDLAEAARTNAKGLAGPTAMAMFDAMLACTAAAADNQAHCYQAIRAAERAIERARPGADEPAWLDFDNGGVAGHAARAMCALGRAVEAEQFAAYAIDNCRPDHTRTRAQRTALLARSLLQAHEWDGAAAAGEKVVDVAWTLDSEHVRREVKGLVDALKVSRAAVVRRFVDRANELLRSRPGGYSFSTT